MRRVCTTKRFNGPLKNVDVHLECPVGYKVADMQLEKHLLSVMKQCDTANMQILSELLIIEAVMFRPNWCGGGADPLFNM